MTWDDYVRISFDFMTGTGTICVGVCFVAVAIIVWRGMFDIQVPNGYVLVAKKLPAQNPQETEMVLTDHRYTASPTDGTTTWIGHCITYVLRDGKLTQIGNTQRML